jgi:HD-GYP domain-containing protein (c-di-GMP phosphodiesterase class II)
MTHARPHRPAMSQEAAIAELLEGAGRVYDSQVVHALRHVTGCEPHASDANVTTDDAALLSQVS